MPYIGRSTDGFGVRNRFLFVASADDTSVSGADANGATLTFTDGAYVDVYLNGVLLKAGTDYNTNTANTIAGLSALSANDEVTVIVYDVFTVADTVSATSGGTFNSGVNIDGNVGIGTTSPSAPLHIAGEGNTGQRVHVGTSSAHQIYLGNTGGVSSVGTLSNHSFQAITNGSSRLTVETDGDVTIEDGDLVIGTGQHGIDFATAAAGTGGTGAAETSTATVLDDYEEGTFTPSSNSVTTGSGSITAVGMYVKVGNLVNISVRFTPSGASTNAHQFGLYLPFKAGTTESSGSYNTWIGGVSFTTAQGTGLNRHFRLSGDSNFGETKVQSSTAVSNTTGNGETGNFSYDMSITYRTID